jgi:uncharacterized protein YjiS (DUF1127 family)
MLNFLIGDRGLRNIRNRGQEFAREMYDPNVFNPQRQAATQQATQGINTNLPRTAALSQLGRIQNDGDIFGGNAGRMVGAMGEQNAAMTRSLAGMETQLGLADQQARMQGRQALANVQSQQLQTAATRDAAVTEADMMYEAEKSSRRFALVGAGIGLGAAAIGSGAFKGGALSLFNKLTGADGIPEGASMDIPTVQGGNLASTLRNRNWSGSAMTQEMLNAGGVNKSKLRFGSGPDGLIINTITPTEMADQAAQVLERGGFSPTFANARRLGAQTFNWNGNSYNTRLAGEPRATAATPTATTAPVAAPAITPMEDLTQPTATGPSEQARASLMTAARSGVGIERLTEAFAPMGFSVDEIQSLVGPNAGANTEVEFAQEAERSGVDLNNMTDDELRALFQEYQSRNVRALGGFIARSPISFLENVSSANQMGRNFVARNVRQIGSGMTNQQIDEVMMPSFLKTLQPDFDPSVSGVLGDFTGKFENWTQNPTTIFSDELKNQVGADYQNIVQRLQRLFQTNR